MDSRHGMAYLTWYDILDMAWQTIVLPRQIAAGGIWRRKVDAAMIRRMGAGKTGIRLRKFRSRSRRWREDLYAFVSDAGCKTTLGPPEVGGQHMPEILTGYFQFEREGARLLGR